MQWIEEFNTKRAHEGLGDAAPREWLENDLYTSRRPEKWEELKKFKSPN